MKKLLLFLFLSLGFIGFSNAESLALERVDLSCSFYESFNWDDLKTTELTPEENSLVIFPQSEQYIYNSLSGYYTSEGNNILFTHVAGDENFGMKFDYSLDRTTSVFKYDFSIKSETTGNEYTERLNS